MKKNKINLIAFFLYSFLMFYSCSTSTDLKAKMKMFKSKNISVPIEKMMKRECSLFMDYNKENNKTFVNFFEYNDCHECTASQIGVLEENIRIGGTDIDKSSMDIIYIISLPPNKVDLLYRDLCRVRPQHVVYFDTCGAFMKANKHFPNDNVFNSFVIDKYGKVLVVGNPFRSKKVKELLLSLIGK